LTLRHPRVVQRVGQGIVGPLQHLFEHLDPKPGQYTEADISPYFWHNGQCPDSNEYKALFDGHFIDYRLRINGLVETPVELDLVQLRALPHHEQITQHFCIQGWSGIAKWGGVSMRTIVDLVQPLPEAKWVVFYSLGEGADTGICYDAPPIEHMSHHLTMLAYDMNDQPLSFGHGAPLRLRNEIELGFKQVKWIKGSSSSPTTPNSEAATAATTKTTNSSATDNPSRGIAMKRWHLPTLEASSDKRTAANERLPASVRCPCRRRQVAPRQFRSPAAHGQSFSPDS
jgi:DMSO/TMAO reductase YedYZ molybdopterin-dependent catalytic subunit